MLLLPAESKHGQSMIPDSSRIHKTGQTNRTLKSLHSQVVEARDKMSLTSMLMLFDHTQSKEDHGSVAEAVTCSWRLDSHINSSKLLVGLGGKGKAWLQIQMLNASATHFFLSREITHIFNLLSLHCQQQMLIAFTGPNFS